MNYALLTVTPMSEFITNATQFFGVMVDGATEVATLFTVWPINLFLAASILGLGAGLLLKFKKK
jgi:hypothetical protein